MIFSTAGIVLRTVKYGDTSGISTVYTRQFGLQSYMVNGIRTAGKNSKAYLYQPASILEMEVYHNHLKKLQRIKEAGWKKVYRSVFTDVIKNSIALFMVELLQKSIIAEEQNETLFDFIEEKFSCLDEISQKDSADFPVTLMLLLPSFLGFEINNNYGPANLYFDPEEGKFIGDTQGVLTERSESVNRSLSLALRATREKTGPPLNSKIRNNLLHLLEKYYQTHLPGFTEMKSLRVIETLLHG